MPAYRPGQGLSGHAVDRLKARTQAQNGAFALPAQDDSKQWDQLLGNGAKKKTRCSVCTRPLGDDKDALGESMCALCESTPNIKECARAKQRFAALGRSAPESRRSSTVNSHPASVAFERVAVQQTPVPVGPLLQWSLTRDAKNALDDERCNKAESSVGSTADPEEAEDESWERYLAESALATPELRPAIPQTSCELAFPSIGSQQHFLGDCKPCAFVYKGGCGNGPACEFCHLCPPGVKKQRKRERKAASKTFGRSLLQPVPPGLCRLA